MKLKKPPKPPKPPNPYARKIVVQARFNSEEMRTLLGKAHSLTDGNISEYIRYVALNFKPKKGDLK